MTLAAVVFVVAAAATAYGSSTPSTPVGIEGVVTLRHRASDLAARPVGERSPIALRISDRTKVGDETSYELRFIATVVGQHDLRGYLVDQAGKIPVMDPLVVSIVPTLPDQHDGGLEAAETPGRGFTLPYSLLVRIALIAWLVFTLLIVVRRLWPARALAIAPPPTPLSLADQLRPLVEAALAGIATTAERARLEAFLLAEWRSRFGLSDMAPAEAICRLRNDSTAAPLFSALETWLHARPGRNEVDVEALLAPYRTTPIIAESQLHGHVAPRQTSEATR